MFCKRTSLAIDRAGTPCYIYCIEFGHNKLGQPILLFKNISAIAQFYANSGQNLGNMWGLFFHFSKAHWFVITKLKMLYFYMSAVIFRFFGKTMKWLNSVTWLNNRRKKDYSSQKTQWMMKKANLSSHFLLAPIVFSSSCNFSKVPQFCSKNHIKILHIPLQFLRKPYTQYFYWSK